MKRFSGSAFRLSTLQKKSSVKKWNENEIFQLFDKDGNGHISAIELRRGMRKFFGLRLKQWELDEVCKGGEITLTSE